MSKPILEEKDILNPNEAIELFVLSRRKFYKLLKEKRKLGFLAMYGSRKLIIRSEFQKYLDKHPELKRRGRKGGEANGRQEAPLQAPGSPAGRIHPG